MIVIFGGGEAQPAAHQVQVVGLEQRQIQPQRFPQRLDADKRRQRLGQCAQVPLPDRHLVAEGIAPFMIRVVADELRVKIIQERKRPEVEGDAEDRHVVGVHHSVAEPIGLPLGDQLRITFDDFTEHRQIRLRLFHAFREVQGQHVLRQLLLQFRLLGVVEIFEMPKAHVAVGQAQHHGGALLFLAPHWCGGTDHTQCTTAWNAQRMQCFRRQKLPDRRAQHRTTIAHARVRGLPGALEVQVPMLARFVVNLAQQQSAPVTQLRVVRAKLMPGIDHRSRLGLGPQLVPAEQLGKYRCFGHGRVEIQQRHGRFTRYH